MARARRSRAARATGRLLVAAMRGDPVDELVGAALPDAARWPTQARIHGVEAFLHAAVAADRRVPPSVRDQLRDDVYRVHLLRAQVLADLGRLQEALGGAGIDVLVVKGPVLGDHVYPIHGRRSYGDLDALVRPTDLGAAVATLEAAGFELADRNWDLLRRLGIGEVHLIGPAGTSIDLHWHLVNQADVRNRFRIDVDDLFDRRRRVDLGPVATDTLAVDDTLVYVALHAALSGGARLIWVEDIARCAAAPDLDWDGAVARAHEWRVVPAFAVMLARTRRTLGLELPPRAVASLGAGRGYATTITPVDVLSPVRDDRGRRSVAKMLGRSCRDSTSASLLALTRSSLRWAVSSGSHFGDAHQTSRDADDPKSPLHPAGGAEDRARYFAEVASNGS